MLRAALGRQVFHVLWHSGDDEPIPTLDGHVRDLGFEEMCPLRWNARSPVRGSRNPRLPGGSTEVTAYRLEEANAALEDLRAGRFRGAAVLRI
jgi:hypothetical protein